MQLLQDYTNDIKDSILTEIQLLQDHTNDKKDSILTEMQLLLDHTNDLKDFILTEIQLLQDLSADVWTDREHANVQVHFPAAYKQVHIEIISPVQNNPPMTCKLY
jgi:hypothetical protein